MKTRSHKQTIELLEWARTHGALHIVVGDVDVLFPPEGGLSASERAPRYEEHEAEDNEPVALPIPRSPLDDPDYYAAEADKWSGFKPLPKI